MRKRIAVVISDIFLRRLTPALYPFVRDGQDYWIIDIARPVTELRRLVREVKPAGILTEEVPGKTGALIDLGLPVVVADTDEAHPGAIGIDVDDWEVGRTAAAFLHGYGFESFAFLGNESNYSAQRGEGYVSWLKKKGYQAQQHIDREKKGNSYMEYYRGQAPLLKKWLRGLPRPVAIFAAHDPLGRLACEVCQECGLSVPEDIAIVGANNDELLCNLSYPPLSSVTIPRLRIGRMAAELLDGLIQHGDKAGKVFRVAPGDVVARESSDFSAIEDPLMRRALQLFRQRYRDPITIQTLCRELNVNRRTLELRFRATLQRTPRQELERQRVAKARTLLVQTDHKMDWIAGQCGFHDAERLSVAFSKIAGEPPSAYRKRLSL